MEDQAFLLWYFLNCETVFKDGTHQKANANKNKYQDIEVEIAKKVYEDRKMANWRWKSHRYMPSITQSLSKFTTQIKKIGTFFLKYAILSTI